MTDLFTMLEQTFQRTVILNIEYSSSGTISINQFYGKSNAAPIDTTVGGNQGTSPANGKFGQVNKGIQAAAAPYRLSCCR